MTISDGKAKGKMGKIPLPSLPWLQYTGLEKLEEAEEQEAGGKRLLPPSLLLMQGRRLWGVGEHRMNDFSHDTNTLTPHNKYSPE